MGPVSVLIKPASGNCNMRCSYCFYCDEMNNREVSQYGVMSDKTLEMVIKKAIRGADGSCNFAFQGGEPTLAGLEFFKKAVELQKSYNSKMLYVANAIQTNAYAIDEQWADFFKQNNFLVGVSLDGPEEIHDRYRKTISGEGSFKKVIAATRMLKEKDVAFNILCVVNSANALRGKEIYEFYKSEGFEFLQFIPCLDPLYGPGGEEHSLSAEQYGQFLCDIFECWFADFKKGKAPSVRTFDNWIGMLLGYPAEECGMCGRCAGYYCVEADGGAYPCDFYVMDEYKLGSFCENSLSQMDKKREEIGFIKRSVPLPDKCMGCPYLMLCRNGCYRAREDGLNRFCGGFKMFFDNCGERLAEAAKIVAKRR